MSTTRRALVTGASSGIGWETVKALTASGWQVLATARRGERLAELAATTGCVTFAADITREGDVARLVEFAAGLPGQSISALVNIAGGALGVEKVSDADLAKWQQMYELNVLGTLRLTKAVLPALRSNGGDVLFITSTAAHDTYPGGAGYVAAKHAERMIPLTLRQELVGEPVRVIEIAPGMVRTPEFSVNRLGSQAAADAVYAGVAEPLTGSDVAEAIRWALELPAHVNVDSMILRPRAQATNTLIAREL